MAKKMKFKIGDWVKFSVITNKGEGYVTDALDYSSKEYKIRITRCYSGHFLADECLWFYEHQLTPLVDPFKILKGMINDL